MRNLRGRVSLLGSLLLPAIATAQGYVALEIDGVAGVDYVGGQAVAAAGDVDGDGVTDVIVGAPSVLQGQAKIFSGATGAQLQVFTGNALNDLFGWAVGGTGDLDGDGNDDVIVGAIHASPGGVSVAGQATVYSGATGAVLWTRNGALAGDFLGWSFARLGDVDSDGVDDTAVGVQLGDNGAAYDAGRVEVLSGATGLPILVLTGAAIADHFGASIALAGDVSGDGIPDLLVGAPEANPGGLADAGTATLYSLANGSVLLQFSGAAAGDHLGTSVAGVGDLDADGVPDLLLGAPQSTVAATGYARAYSGATAGLLFTVGGVGVFEDFGASVCGVGDLNGDVVPDFLVGAPDAGPGVGGGRVRAVSGATGGILYDALGTVNDGALGTALAGLPDLDGDGVPDFVAGEPGIFQSAGLARVRSGANGAPVFTFLGQYLGDQFGRAAASVGDVDGDGRDDLVVGAPNADAGGLADSGRATLHSSAGGGVLVTVDGPSESALLGGSVAGLGDMDGDGVPDFAVGSPGEAQATGSVRVVSSASGAILLNLSGIGPTDQFGSCVAG
ncbi:MAG TPA: integrin alpha, partial [Planctomycetota bacterium]|nr:integrin alpha [Planctomycetota bacterium]